MRQFLLVIIFLSIFNLAASGQDSLKLSDDAEISVITMGPYYEELYAAFGHSAIRVYDPINGLNLAYNYGTFDFNQPNFYLNFARGHLLYKLSVQDYKRLSEYYIYYNRFIHEQILDLNRDQKQLVFDYLQNNALPENASYNYDYFYDNCATRIRDVFVQTLGYTIRFDGSHITSDRSIRELTDDYLDGYYPWGDLGIDLCLGLPMDKIMTPIEYMYIPDYVEYAFDNGWLKTARGEKPLVRNKKIVFEPENMQVKKTWLTPSVIFLFCLVLIAYLTRNHKKKEIRGNYLDFTLFMIIGLLGLFLTMLWFLTDHKAASDNLNIIWAFPVHLIAAFSLLKSGITNFWKTYFKATAIMMVILLLLWPVLPQMMPTSFMFIAAIIMLRAGYVGWSKAYARNNSARE